jgi:tRNA1(Val) A37 N6-methylase TrmN6
VLWGCAEFPKLAAFAAAAPLLLGRDTPAVEVEAVERQKEVAQRA